MEGTPAGSFEGSPPDLHVRAGQAPSWQHGSDDSSSRKNNQTVGYHQRNPRCHQMSFIRRFSKSLIVLIALGLGVGASAQAPPAPSVKFVEAMQRHSTRLQNGEKEAGAFYKDLEVIAKEGDPIAQFMLAAPLIENDRPRAIQMLRKSAAAGCAGSAGLLGTVLLEENREEALKWIRFAAEHGDAMSMLLVGTFFEKGSYGYSVSTEYSLAWYELSQRQAYSKALIDRLPSQIASLRARMTPQQLEQSKKLFLELSGRFPKVAFYLGGQSLP